ncbi:MAG: hypothetical protein QXR58_02660 [Candidatus Micrarchaeaceae archaeon]
MTYFPGYTIAVAIIAIMLAVSGILLGMGYALDDRKLKELGRSELVQSLINGVIVGSLMLAFSQGGLVVSLIDSIAAMPNTASCTGALGSNTAICFAYNYLAGIAPVTVNGVQHQTLLSSALTLLAPLSLLYVVIAVIGALKISIIAVSFSFSGILTPLLSQLNYAISAIVFAITGIEVQAVLLKFVGLTAVPVLLPAGIVLRTFYFTRRLGGAIIAVAIGLFAVFPLTYLLDAQLTGEYSNTINSSAISSLALNATQVKNALAGESVHNNSTSLNFLDPVINVLGGLMVQVEGAMERLVNYIALLIVEVFFLPTFSVILTIVSIRELARIMGSEISFGRFDIF